MIKFVKQLFCKHSWEWHKPNFAQPYIVCLKCGRRIEFSYLEE